MRIPNLDIYEGMPDHTMVNAKDMMSIFGYKGKPQATDRFVKVGLMPSPSERFDDLRNDKSKSYGYRNFSKSRENTANRKFWTLGDLRKIKLEMETKQ